MDNNDLNKIKDEIYEKYKHILQGKEGSIQNIIAQIVNYYEDIIRCMPGNVYVFDMNLTPVACNQNVLDMLRYKSVEEFKQKTFEAMGVDGAWSKDAEQSFKKDTLDVIRNKQPKLNVEEPPIPGKDGTTTYFLTSRVPIFSNSGDVSGVVGISIDITERKRMEEDLIKAKESAEVANELKDEFIMNMTHDFNTPLIGLKYPSEVLYKSKDKFDPELQEMIELMHTSAQRMSDLVTQILDFSRINAGKVEVKSEQVDLGQLIRLAVDNTAARCREKGLELVVNYPPDVPRHIISDSMYITRILLNLVSNAIRYTSEGTITIRVEKEPSQEKDKVLLKISINDTGVGIPEDKLRSIFEKFNRVEPAAASSDYSAGVGLGLSIVEQFVKTLDGQITVKSKEGQGSTFIITLPVVVDDANVAMDSFATAHPNLAVLFISDNTAMAESMAYQLITPSFDMYHIKHVESALKKAQSQGQEFDIILLDAASDLDPVSFKAQLKSAPEGALWVLLTKPLTQAEKEGILSAGYAEIIQKPVLPEELHQKLQSVFENQ